MTPCEQNAHVKYENPISSGMKVMAKAKVFVHETNADADTMAMA